MSAIFYYSNFCNNCKNLLQFISKENLQADMHFINIDNRIKKNNATYIVLQNKQEILLPPSVTSVPAILLLNQNQKVIFSHDIGKYLENKKMSSQIYNQSQNNSGSGNLSMAQQAQMRQQQQMAPQQRTQQSQQQQQRPSATQQMMQQSEPSAFSFDGGSAFGVVSDSFSFLDQDPESLLAKGNGGMRQQHHYVRPDVDTTITTPPDNYSPDKIGSVSVEQMQQQRNNDVSFQRR